jgi:ABC-type branched-subunit amino acid transport system substrate-binding protein
MDDKFEPAIAAENARTLITHKHVLALFLTRGTPHTQAVLPVLAEHQVPLIGPSTGAMALHAPVNPLVFNVRAPYQREAERAVRHLGLTGVERIAVLQVDDSFGEDAVKGVEAGFSAVQKKPAVVAKFDRSKPDFKPIVSKLVAAEVQAAIIIGPSAAVAEGVRALREAGSRASVITLSNNASSGFIKELGADAPGTIVTQVFPHERSVASPIVKEAMELASAKSDLRVTPAMMEGFAAAKVLVEALKRAGPKPTRARLVAVLNGMQKVDIGGMEINFSPASHSGLSYTDISIVGADGKFRR